MLIIPIGVAFLVFACSTEGANLGISAQSLSPEKIRQTSTDCPNDCFDHCLSNYGGRLSKGKTYYCQKGCAAMRGGRVTYPNKFCCNPNFDTCKQSCQGASRSQANRRICEFGCTFWKENKDITATCDCPNDCFDHCWRRYGGTLLKGNMYYCQKGCAGLKGGQVIHSDRYCCTRNFETCKENCQRASSSRANIERCEYGCTFWKENPTIPERCATCDDGIKNQGETDVDCGGPCSTCPTCNDGIQNQGETGVDCGGPCTACPTCNDGIQNQGETGVDCGGSCTACPTCDDGIQNQGESGVDCGSPCTACPTCDDNIENQGETGVDCGGPCTACPTCNDGIQNQEETGVDCGGQCTACQGENTVCTPKYNGYYSYGDCGELPGVNSFEECCKLTKEAQKNNQRINRFSYNGHKCYFKCGGNQDRRGGEWQSSTEDISTCTCNLVTDTTTTFMPTTTTTTTIPVMTTTTIDTATTNAMTECILSGVDYFGGDMGRAVDGLETKEKCQKLCQDTLGCSYFTWASTEYWRPFTHKKCFLKDDSNEIEIRPTEGLYSGPKFCPVDCEWGSYGEWTSCSVLCGGGDQSRSRRITTPASNGGQACQGNATETQSCNSQACPVDCEWGSYGEWTSCSVSCGGGDQSRSRPIATPASNGGQACQGNATETQSCNSQACPVDCEWGSYGEWTSCSVSCGGGDQSRSRPIATPASNGGQACEGNATETQSCNSQACPVDCEWGSYGEWTSCSVSCGGGDQSRSRPIATPASNGGQACQGNATETRICNKEICQNRLIVIAGVGPGRLSSAQMINVEQNSICNLPSLPHWLYGHSSAIIPSGILVCGGNAMINQRHVRDERCYLYRKSTSLWEPFASMTTRRASFDMEYLNHGIWAIAGEGNSEAYVTLDYFNMTSNLWTKQSIPFNAEGHCLTKISEHKLILIGGLKNDQRTTLSDTWIIDTISNTWTRGPNMKSNRFRHGCFSVTENGKITMVVVMGGICHGCPRTLKTAEFLDVQSMEWNDLPNLPYEVYHSKGVESVVGPYLGYSVGGYILGHQKRIIGFRKKQGGNGYEWDEINMPYTGFLIQHAVVNAPSSLVPSC